QAELEFGRLERGVALEQLQTEDRGLVEQYLAVFAECVVFERPGDVLRADPGRDPRGFETGIRNRRDVEKPVVANDRLVALQRVCVVGVEQIFFAPQRIEDTPAVRDRQVAAGLERFWRRQRCGIDDRRDAFGWRLLACHTAP